MQRRRFLKLTSGGVVLAATLPPVLGCAHAGMPPAAVTAWRGPEDGLELRRWLLSYAILAPHSHNLQSWLVDLDEPAALTLFVDPERTLPVTDPLGRQLMMSHGTFLEVLDLAARSRGLRAEVELFPEGPLVARWPREEDRRPVARVRLVEDASVTPDPLFAEVLRRHTNRERYAADRPVAAEAWQAMARAASTQPARAGFVGPEAPDLDEHRRIAREAWRIELCTPEAILETYRVLRVGSSEIEAHRDGISLNDPQVVWLDRLGLLDRKKAPGPDDYATTSQVEEFNDKIASTPGFFWLVTDDNDRVTQVNAGRAWVRAQLAATAHGVAMQPLQQALQEYAEQRGPYGEVKALLGATAPGQTVQMWARAGYAPAVDPAPRRGLAAHLL